MKKSQNMQILKIVNMIGDYKATVEEIRGELQSKYEERSDTWQESDAGDKALEEIDNVEDVLTVIEELEDVLSRFV